MTAPTRLNITRPMGIVIMRLHIRATSLPDVEQTLRAQVGCVRQVPASIGPARRPPGWYAAGVDGDIGDLSGAGGNGLECPSPTRILVVKAVAIAHL